MRPPLLECVVNVSEGCDPDVLAAIAGAGAPALLDLHSDQDHNRSVLTLAGPAPVLEDAARAVARATLERIDLRLHQGVHPRLGSLDVVPFVPLGPTGSPCGPDGDLTPALEARRRFATWAGEELALPCFFYGPERSLPDVRREAFGRLGRTRLRPELARAHLLYGEWLRREGRRVAAREQLRTAYDMLVAIGMEAFAERARRELSATGQKVRKRSVERQGQLTPQEEQIAQLARDGLSNPQIGARLFLSARTVEWHLRELALARLGQGGLPA